MKTFLTLLKRLVDWQGHDAAASGGFVADDLLSLEPRVLLDATAAANMSPTTIVIEFDLDGDGHEDRVEHDLATNRVRLDLGSDGPEGDGDDWIFLGEVDASMPLTSSASRGVGEVAYLYYRDPESGYIGAQSIAFGETEAGPTASATWVGLGVVPLDWRLVVGEVQTDGALPRSAAYFLNEGSGELGVWTNRCWTFTHFPHAAAILVGCRCSGGG